MRGAVELVHSSEAASGNADVVLWLTPAQGASSFSSGQTARLFEKGKKFIPHVVAVTQGTEIEFPNQDLFFHNVFSIHQGKTIDLGLAREWCGPQGALHPDRHLLHLLQYPSRG